MLLKICIIVIPTVALNAMKNNSFDEQLNSIVHTMTITLQDGSKGIAFDGGRVFYENNMIKSRASANKFLGRHICHYCDKKYMICDDCFVRNHYTTYFDARPLEEAVLAHMQGQVLTTPKFIYNRKTNIEGSDNYSDINIPDDLIHNLDTSKSPLPLRILALITLCQNTDYKITLKKYSQSAAKELVINYLLHNPKAPTTLVERKTIIQQYIPIKEQFIHHCLFHSSDICLKEHLAKEISSESSRKYLSDAQSMIEGYLEYNGDITVPITNCILDANEHLDANAQLTHWLLQEKNGWYYLDTLLVKCFKNFKNYTLDSKIRDQWEHRFWQCLKLLKQYRLLKKIPTKIRNWLFQYDPDNNSLSWPIYLINTTQYTQQEINTTFLRAIPNIKQMQYLIERGANDFDTALYVLKTRFLKFRHNMFSNLKYYYDKRSIFPEKITHPETITYTYIINMLLEHNADPNQLFYRDKKNRKKCYLRSYCHEETIPLLSRILLHPNRVHDQDEPTDFEYLKDQRIFSIVSLFDNGKDTGQQDLYTYAMRVYELAFEGRKTNNFKPLKNLIIDRYQKSQVVETK